MKTHSRTALLRSWFALPVAAVCALPTVHAASVCVTNSAQLYSALIQSQSQPVNTPFTINLMQGSSYSVGYLDLVPTSPITLAGGYTDASCTPNTRQIDPANTVLDLSGNGAIRISQLSGSPKAGITVEGITFTHGIDVSLNAGNENDGSSGDVIVRQSRFTNLTSAAGPHLDQYTPVTFWTNKGSVGIVNTVFDHLQQTQSSECEVEIDLNGAADASLGFVSADTSNGKSFCVSPDFSGAKNPVIIYNSIFWPNDQLYGTFAPLHFHDYSNSGTPPDVSLYYNTIFNHDGPATVQDFATLSANPQDNPRWMNPIAGAGANYNLLPSSTAVNSGLPVGIIPYPATDMQSGARVVGGVPDRGALESLFTVAPTTVVTNTNDSGPGSLRAALTFANKYPDVDTITFALPTCPAIIKLQTPLPVHQPVIIDGYKDNALASQNSDPNAFNATLCVILEEETPGTVIDAFHVDTGGLTLSGIAFGGFYDQISISGGSDHKISGNQFGGTVAGIPLTGATTAAILVQNMASGNVTIGGNTPGERNVITHATVDGVLMDNTVTTAQCYIKGNLIGLAADGTGAAGNGNGIELRGNNCEVSKNRIAANFLEGIWINGGASNLVQANIFGLDAKGNSTQSYGWAVRVDGNLNVIGAPEEAGYSPTLGNAISFMGSGGVLVNGARDSVRANLSSFNGDAHDGSAPDIKLAPNANFNQPYPVIDGVAFSNGSVIVSGHLKTDPNYTDRIDVYSSAACAPSGRGHAELYLGSKQVATDASGMVSFSIPLTMPNSPATAVLSLTSTDYHGNSSEMGACFSFDRIFKDGFEPLL
ncbi:hypothetical protein GCM10009105_10200 [Dokdonella soli]|uniref:Periplasmic copper-binding protein NosD beta helix domain-containing protein n=2 Tax=Dokdonella soli TaxID=529810 RepID=A0ABP3TJY8_9GAMM